MNRGEEIAFYLSPPYPHPFEYSLPVCNVFISLKIRSYRVAESWIAGMRGTKWHWTGSDIGPWDRSTLERTAE